MKGFLILLFLLPLIVHHNLNNHHFQAGPSGIIAKSCSRVISRNADGRGCSRLSRNIPEPESPPKPIATQHEMPPHSAADEAAQTIKSSWDELPLETISRSKIHVGTGAETIKDSFLRNAKNPQLLVAMPTNPMQYKIIYREKQNVSYSAKQELLDFHRNLLSTPNASYFEGGAVHLFNIIESIDDNFIVVFAHSEDNGRTLVLPNGDPLTDFKIHEYCAKLQKVCVVLTCHGDDFEIIGKLTANEGLAMWNAAFHKNMHQEVSIYDYIYQMRLKRHNMERNKYDCKNRIFPCRQY